MGLLWPVSLLLLAILPVLVAAYLWMLRRRRPALRYSSLLLVREALPQASRLRRHLPFALFSLALASLALAAARPVATINVPIGQTTIILALDVSRSMCSTDVPPNRLEAAREAARSYIRRQTANTQLGIVAFAGFAELIQTPTGDQEVLEDALENLTPARRTAIGSAILESLDAIAEVNQNVAPVMPLTGSEARPTPVPAGTYLPDIIVLLTDGASNTGPWPLDAAQMAVDRGIRIYTIGFGTDHGAEMNCGDSYFGGFGGGGGGYGFDAYGGGFRRALDEPTLKQIAALTGGTYYSASSAGELQEVFRELPTYLITRQEHMEISVAFAAAGALLVALAMLLALLWQPLP
jgi:Ca-activated chloride channel family protein